MNRFVWIVAAIVVAIVLVVGLGLSHVLMPGQWRKPSLASGYTGLVPAEKMLRVPVSGIYPGGNTSGLEPAMENPLKNDPDAVVRGMRDFDTFNCSGCHMGNGGGGMGPALSNRSWIYRDSPANIYLSIAQGRSAGMPAFGAMLPDRTIWELVAYIQNLSSDPDRAFGTTTSATPSPPPIEQVPVNQVRSPTPWRFTETMPPDGEKNGTEAGKPGGGPAPVSASGAKTGGGGQ
jgi:cytochrome c oxidase cbb3-type subunit 3